MGVKLKFAKNIKLYNNVPVTEVNDIIYFRNITERDQYFNSYVSHEMGAGVPVNFLVEHGNIRLPVKAYDYEDTNWISFTYDDNREYFCMITNRTTKDPEMANTTFEFVICPFTTFLCDGGTKLNSLGNVFTYRRTINHNDNENLYLQVLQGSDTMKVSQKFNVYNYEHQFSCANDKLYVIIESACDLFTTDLQPDFHYPIYNASKGTRYDGMSGVTDLYIIPYSVIHDFLHSLNAKTWVTQNFIKCFIVQEQFVDLSDIDWMNVAGHQIGRFKNSAKSKSRHTLFTVPKSTITGHIPGYTDERWYLLNNAYVSGILTNFDTDHLNVDFTKLFHHGFNVEVKMSSVLGHYNETRFYIHGYGANGGSGEYYNSAITLNHNSEVPIMYSQGNIALSKNYFRKTNEFDYSTQAGNVHRTERYIENGDYADATANMAQNKYLQNEVRTAGKLLDRASHLDVGGYLKASADGVANQLKIRYNDNKYWDTERARQMDFRHMPQKIKGNYDNTFCLAKNEMQITLQIMSIDLWSVNKVVNYHSFMGFEINCQERNPHMVFVNKYADFVKCEVMSVIPGIDVNYSNMIRNYLKNGMRFWYWVPGEERNVIHNRDMTQNIRR